MDGIRGGHRDEQEGRWFPGDRGYGERYEEERYRGDPNRGDRDRNAVGPRSGVDLPPLPYPNNALEPHIDALTMEIHHDRHHKAYVDNLNKALEGQAALASKPIEQLLRDMWIAHLALVRRSDVGLPTCHFHVYPLNSDMNDRSLRSTRRLAKTVAMINRNNIVG